jgi:superfamily II DNA helicase RecQ
VQFKFFVVPADGDDPMGEELNRFLRGRRVVSVERKLVGGEENPRWAFCVGYLEGPGGAGGAGKGGAPRVDYKEVLSAEDFAVFARLRETRKELAEKEAVPAYAVLTNEQLAAVARKRPASVAQLREIDGIGQAKADKYGEALLGVMAGKEAP